MKFAIAAIFTLALALGAQSSVIPWGHVSQIAGHGLAYTAVSGPAVVPVHAVHAVHAPWGHTGAAWHDDGQWHGHAHDVHGLPIAVHAAHPSVVVSAHAPHVVVAPAHEGTYVAKTRGAVHTAPLSGHINSVTSINAAPAPGTI